MWSDRLVEAEQHLERMLWESRRVGNRLGFVAASSILGLVDRRRGALLAADRDAGACLELGQDLGANAAFLTAAWSIYGDVAVDRGLPPAELRERLEALTAVEHDEDALPYGLVLHARARLELELGDHAAAIAGLRAAGRRETAWGATCPAVVPWRSTLATALMAAGEPEEAAAPGRRGGRARTRVRRRARARDRAHGRGRHARGGGALRAADRGGPRSSRPRRPGSSRPARSPPWAPS
jgi:hypothetical protein